MAAFNNSRQLATSSYDGLFLATVVDNNDKKKQQRVRIRIPNVIDAEKAEDLPWILPRVASSFGVTDSAVTVSVPAIGSKLLVSFQGGDVHFPVFEGYVHLETTAVPEPLATNYPDRRGFVDPSGNIFYVDNKEGSETVYFKHKSGTELTILADGTVQVKAVKDINMEAPNIKLKATTKITLDTPNTEVTGDTLLDKKLTVTQDVTANANVSITGNTTATGNVSVTGILKQAGVNVGSTHTHGGVQGGPGTTSPVIP
jgi:phage baseplate assembly protein gpV